jgi:multiple sugar transport system permease protein
VTVDRERSRLWLMAAPFLFGVSLLVICPLIVTIASSLTDWDLVRAPRFIGLSNFSDLFGDEVFRASLRNSLAHMAVAVPLQVIGGVGFALLLRRSSIGSRIARAAVLLPTVLPEVAAAVVWLWILNPIGGPVNLALDAVGLPTPAWLTEPTVARWAVVLMSMLVLGYGFLIALAVRASIPDGLYELASTQGAAPLGQFWRVTVPLLLPAFVLIVALNVLFSLQTTFIPALIVTRGGPPPYATTYLPLFVYRNAFEYLRYGYAAAATTWMIVLTAAVVWLVLRIGARWRRQLAGIIPMR